MPIVPNLLERSLLRFNQLPGGILDLIGAAVFRVVGAALKLGVFESLAKGPATEVELAQRLSISQAGAEQMLQLLASAGYVEEKKGRFANTALTTRWLLRGSPDSIVDLMVLWQGIAFDQWSDLEAAIRSGRPELDMTGWLSRRGEDGWPVFNAAMAAQARLESLEVSRRLRIPDTARRLADLGGSHGLYSLALVNRFPQLSATIFDVKEAIAAAEKTIAEHAMSTRMSTQVANVEVDDVGSGWDVVLMFNFLHYFEASKAAALVRKAAGTLAAGGQLIIMDQLADQAPLPLATAMVQALSMEYFAALGGRAYRFDEVAGWMRDAGLGAPRRIGLRKSPGQNLLIASRA
jgi:hypothetical protein